MNNYDKYINYLIHNGDIVNSEIDHNIYAKEYDHIRMLLLDYIIDTIDNYDYRDCPDYDGFEYPVIPENSVVYYYELEDSNDDGLLLEDGNHLYMEFNRNNTESNVLSSEDRLKYISQEASFNKYVFDKLLIEGYLHKLINNLQCYE